MSPRISRSRPAAAGSTTTGNSRSSSNSRWDSAGSRDSTATRRHSEDGTVKKLNLTYRFDKDRLVYATYSEGFRVGGSNPLKPASALPREYKSDTIEEL